MKKAVLFDLDGTLIGMEIEPFLKVYLGELCVVLSAYGYEPKEVKDGIMHGIYAMQQNDGTKTNEEVFWADFERFTGKDTKAAHAACDAFYSNEFHKAKVACPCLPLSKTVVQAVREKGLKVILATNPVFPKTGVLSRLSWNGLKESDFDYITSYENERYCKPNPNYYLETLRKNGLSPEECIMVGNDEKEDMYGAALAGIDGFFLTDEKWILPCKEHPHTEKSGTMSDFLTLLNEL